MKIKKHPSYILKNLKIFSKKKTKKQKQKQKQNKVHRIHLNTFILRILIVLQRFGKSECSPSQRDLLFPKAKASVFSLFIFKKEHSPKVFSVMNRFAIFDEAGHIISENGKFNRFISYRNALNASYLYS